MTEAQTSGTGNAAPSQVTDTPVSTIVAQVKEARIKEIAGKGNIALANVLRDDGKAGDKVEATQVAGEEAPTTPVPEPDKAAEERRAARAKELATLAQKGWQKVQEKKQARAREAETQRDKANYEAKLAELAAEREQLALAAKDPIAFLEKSGVPPEEIAKRVVQRGSPMAQTEALKLEIETLKKDIAERESKAEADRKAAQEQQQRAQQTQEARRQEAAFVQLATDETKYPHLSALYTPAQILTQAQEIIRLAWEEKPGVIYDNSEIADLLEQQAIPRFEKLRGRIVTAPKTSESPRADAAHETGPKTSRTLTSNMQAENTTDPTAFKKLPKWRQNQILGERLKAAQEAKARAK